MLPKSYIHIFAPEPRMEFSSFHLYLPAASSTDNHDYYVEYRFLYEHNPIVPDLKYNEGPNNPANRDFYRICQAFVVKKDGDVFHPVFRALQRGEIGFALREKGAGDFVGGYHGDETLLDVKLMIDGKKLTLNREYFASFETCSFYEQSYIYRCNTPETKLMLHTQNYCVDGTTLRLDQEIRWLTDAFPLQNVFMPMLTAQRINPDHLEQILTDTVEFYAPDGSFVAGYDTTPYGIKGNDNVVGDDTISVCEGTFATAAKVYGKKSGFCAEAGYRVLDQSIPDEQIATHLCIRFMPHALDNKIYFSIGAGIQPKAGTIWKSNVYYRISYNP